MGDEHALFATTGGIVEAVVTDGAEPPVLYFHGGHESATAAPAAELYRELGHRVVAPSRPGYGRTRVGPLAADRFARLADEVRAALGIERFQAVVGTSFGGLAAIEYVGRYPRRATVLILHSVAPSTWPYPDSRAQRLMAPILFHPWIERFTWAMTRALLRRSPEWGLAVMMAPLSTHIGSSWLAALPAAEREEMRAVFAGMRSRSGFVNDLRQARSGRAGIRRRAQRRVARPTLITASREDGGVAWRHAADFSATIADARLVELPAPSHLFWIGATRGTVLAAVRDFLTTTDR